MLYDHEKKKNLLSGLVFFATSLLDFTADSFLEFDLDEIIAQTVLSSMKNGLALQNLKLFQRRGGNQT